MDDTIDQALRRLIVDEGCDPEVATDKVLDGTTRAKLVDLLRPLVLLRAKNCERRTVRRLEQRSFGQPIAEEGDDADNLTRHEARVELVRHSFALPDGRFVTWGDATTEDHLQRAGWLHCQASSLAAGARRHEVAATLITSTGCAALGDIPDWSAQLDRILKDAA